MCQLVLPPCRRGVNLWVLTPEKACDPWGRGPEQARSRSMACAQEALALAGVDVRRAANLFAPVPAALGHVRGVPFAGTGRRATRGGDFDVHCHDRAARAVCSESSGEVLRNEVEYPA